MSSTELALFPGDCVICDEPYERGDRIVSRNGGDYQHAACPTLPAREFSADWDDEAGAAQQHEAGR